MMHRPPATPLPVFSGRSWLPVSPKYLSPSAPSPFAVVAPPPKHADPVEAADAADSGATCDMHASVVSAIDSLLHEDDRTIAEISTLHFLRRQATPRGRELAGAGDDDDIPPPPFEDDDDDGTASEASVRSSPDDNYDPKTAPHFASEPVPHAPSKTFLPFRFGGGIADDAADDLLLEDLEATSARNDENESSYNGGTTDEGEDDGEDDEAAAAHAIAVPLDAEEDVSVTGSELLDTCSSRSASVGVAHLDMEAQRRQVEYERSQRRTAYHADMQRTVCLAPEDRHKAIQCLLNEAHRYHARQAAMRRPHIGDQVWRGHAEEVRADLLASGHPTVQRNLSCMCIFSGVSGAREYGDHEEERSRRQAGQHRTLQALRMQAARGGSAYFLKTPAAPMASRPASLF